MNRLAPSVLLIVLAALAGCEKEDEAKAPVVRPVLSVIAEARQTGITGFAGTVQPQIETELSFRVIGRLVARDVNVGDLVKKDQRLAAIDPTAMELAVRSATADLDSARAQLVNASTSAERLRILRRTNTAPQAMLENAEQALSAAQADVLKGEAALSKAREQLSYTEIKADFDAVVTATSAEIGQVVAAGQTVATIARPDLRDAVVDMPLEVGSITIGAPFTVALQIDPATTVAGKVREISPQADPSTRTYRVRIALDNAPASFRLGTTITAYPADGSTTAMELPLSALLTKDGKSFVWVVDEKATTVASHEIKVAQQTDKSFLVGDGIEPGTRVVTAGVHSLSEGQAVRIDEGIVH